MKARKMEPRGAEWKWKGPGSRRFLSPLSLGPQGNHRIHPGGLPGRKAGGQYLRIQEGDGHAEVGIQESIKGGPPRPGGWLLRRHWYLATGEVSRAPGPTIDPWNLLPSAPFRREKGRREPIPVYRTEPGRGTLRIEKQSPMAGHPMAPRARLRTSTRTPDLPCADSDPSSRKPVAGM